MTKTKPITVTGTVERCDLKSRKPYMPHYYSQAEHDEFYLDVAIRLADGSAVYFTTPAAGRAVASCPGAAVVTFNIPPATAEWLKQTGDVAVARRPGVPSDRHVAPLVAVGDTITVRGSVKREAVSKSGNPYRVLNRIQKA